MDELSSQLFGVSTDIRYVAIYRDGSLAMTQRPGVLDASGAESDRYEELLVNPTLLTLAAQRGNIDCGGLEYLLVRYGNFFQLVLPVERGHVSVSIELGADPPRVAAGVRGVLRTMHLLRESGGQSIESDPRSQ